MANNESEAMVQCTEEMIATLTANDPKSIGDALLAAGLLPRNVHSKLSLQSIAAEKARQIVAAVTDKVIAKSDDFAKFISVLKKTRLNNLAKLLQDKLSKYMVVVNGS